MVFRYQMPLNRLAFEIGLAAPFSFLECFSAVIRTMSRAAVYSRAEVLCRYSDILFRVEKSSSCPQHRSGSLISHMSHYSTGRLRDQPSYSETNEKSSVDNEFWK